MEAQDAIETPEQPETRESLTKKYNILCAQAGDLSYKIKCNEGELLAVQKEIHETVLESAKLQGADKQ